MRDHEPRSTLPDHRDDRPAALVSVVIPVFNGGQVLPAQLEALSRQTYDRRFEVVVADNGSTDGTAAVARGFADRFETLRVVDASDVQGPSHARNVGAAAAAGDLLLFCDADDVVDTAWVAAMVAAATDADLLAGVGLETRDPEEHVWGEVPLPAPERFRFLPWRRSSNLAIRREAFDAVGGFDESRRIGEDVDLCWRVQLAGYRFAFVADAEVAYRERDTLAQAALRQYRFGRAAPGLYRDFVDRGAPRPDLVWLVGGGIMALRSLPRALIDAGARRRWIALVAGILGRWVGEGAHRLAEWRAQRTGGVNGDR